MKKLDIRWISQLDAQSQGANDCGQACVVMLLRYYGFAGDSPIVDDLSRIISGRTTWQQLQTLASRYEMTLSAGPNPTPDVLRGYISQGHAPILLVDYKSLELPDHLASGPDQGLHWLLAVGYDDYAFYLHDPLWTPAQRDGQGGAYVPIASATLMNALRGVNLHHWRAVDVPPIPATRLGVHIVPGPRNGYGDFLTARPALVKAVDEGGALLEAKRVSPDTVTIFRVRQFGDLPGGNFTGDPSLAARAWMAQVLPIWQQNPADYYEPINEPDPPDLDGYRWLADFMLECMALGEAAGVKLAIYSFAAGVPEPEEFRALLPSLQAGAARGHILALHEYPLLGDGTVSDPANAALIGRYRMYHALCPDVRIAIAEMSPVRGGHQWDALGAQTFIDGAIAYDALTRRDDYVLGFALWTLGQWEGHNSNFQDVLPELGNWIRHHQD